MKIAYIPESYELADQRHHALEQVRLSKMESARRQVMPHAPALLNTHEIGGGAELGGHRFAIACPVLAGERRRPQLVGAG
jgi:hypothetical protein